LNTQGRGKFIVLEGIDGSGKSRQATLLAQYLNLAGVDVEPTGHDFGKLIRAALSGARKFDPTALALLFATDRIEHSIEISRRLVRGENVVGDRYALSNLVYYAAGTHGPLFGPGFIERLNWIAHANEHAIAPDLYVVLDVPVDVALARLQASDKPRRELFEHKAFLERAETCYRHAELVLRPKNLGEPVPNSVQHKVQIVHVSGVGRWHDVQARIVEAIHRYLGDFVPLSTVSA
jgi:dTMP kinase